MGAMEKSKTRYKSTLRRNEVCFMCESNVYLRDDNVEKLFMEDVAQLKRFDGRIWIVDLLGRIGRRN